MEVKMPHPFEWRRLIKNNSTIIKNVIEEKFPGNKYGKFVAPDGSLIQKTFDGKIKICKSRNQRKITLN